MKHTIHSYKQEELYTTRQDYTAEAENDAEALTKIQELRQAGHTISGWIQNNEHVHTSSRPSAPSQGN